MSSKAMWRNLHEGERVLPLLKEEGTTFVAFDTETTGLSEEKDRIIQLSCIKCVTIGDYKFKPVAKMNVYINPGVSLSQEIVDITGITDELLYKEGKSEEELWPTIHNLFGDDCLVCGHNVSFDIRFMTALYSRHQDLVPHFEPLDTLQMARELYKKEEVGNHKLGTLLNYFGLNEGLRWHDSLDDIKGTLRLLRVFLDDYQEKMIEEQNRSRIKTTVLNTWTWTGFRGEQRLYAKLAYEDRKVYISQRRPYQWGEKDPGTLDLVDMEDVERQVLAMYGVSSLDDLSKVRESRYYSAKKRA